MHIVKNVGEAPVILHRRVGKADKDGKFKSEPVLLHKGQTSEPMELAGDPDDKNGRLYKHYTHPETGAPLLSISKASDAEKAKETNEEHRKAATGGRKDINALRADFKTAFGKAPDPKMTATALQTAIDEKAENDKRQKKE